MKYKFYNIKNNQVKNCKIFSPYTQFKNKGFEFRDIKKTKKHPIFIDDQSKNIVYNLNWKRYLFNFDARYRDQNLFSFSFFLIKAQEHSQQVTFL